MATANAKKDLASLKNICFINNKYNNIKKCDSLIIATEHNEFKKPDFDLLMTLKQKTIFDGRNLLNASEIKKKGLTYFGIGV